MMVPSTAMTTQGYHKDVAPPMSQNLPILRRVKAVRAG
jgi:hypothetical protein